MSVLPVRRALVTPALVAACVAIYAAMVAAGVDWLAPTVSDSLKWGATYGPLTAGGQEWRLASSMFVHAGLIHLALNMWVLWDIGRFVERQIGPWAFLAAYLVAGLCGSLMSLAWNPHLAAVGASGAVFGLYGLVLGWLPRARHAFGSGVWKGLGRNALFFVVVNLAFGASNPAIDNAAHLGGLLGGLAIGLGAGPALLSDQRVSKRLASVGIAAAGLAAFIATVAFWPAPPDFQAQLERFNALALRTDEQLSAIDADTHSPPAARLKRLEETLRAALPEWRTIRTTLAGYGPPPPHRERVVTGVLEHMTLMEEAWISTWKASKVAIAQRWHDSRKSVGLRWRRWVACPSLDGSVVSWFPGWIQYSQGVKACLRR